ncbi:MAG TPA: serine hydrolase [Burkholderiales bacterium]|jgi:CubicO group peptidase (beta-lactamase class C family)|nr:serine hydrolase [Burkholderiales bacterium]
MNRDRATLANWRTAPGNRWAFHHVRELIPTADIPNDPRRIRDFPAAPRELDLGNFLQQTDSDGMAVVHRGRLVFEHYANGMSEETPHILMSVTKSLLGLLFGSLGLDPGTPVTQILPELKGTAYAGATPRHLLDMRAGIAFEEDYLATSGPIVEYRKATGWNPLAPGEAPSDLHSFYSLLTRADGRHGGRFHYVSPNSDLLGWLIERASGERYADLMSARLWKKIGAQRSAYITVDRLGAPRTAGGMCVTLRDLARVGQWTIENPSPWLDDIEKNGDRAAWDAGSFVSYFPGLPIHYRSQWYVLHGATPLVFALGIHGQNLFVDRARELVVAKLSSQALPLDAGRIAITIQQVVRLRDALA